jgi:HNH endonuclease
MAGWASARVSPTTIFFGHHNRRAEKRSRAHGEKSPNWKGGRHRDSRGYVLVRAPWHPHAMSGGYVLEHRLVVEQHWGAYFLEPEEVVHHKNGVKDDNRFENLQVLPSNAAHSLLHGRNGRWTTLHAAGVECGTTERPHAGRGLCRGCYNYRRKAERRRRP